MSKFTYTTRADGRLVKKVTIKKKPTYVYDYTVEGLKKQYYELMNRKIKGKKVNEGGIRFGEFAEKWLKLASIGKAEKTIQENRELLDRYILIYWKHKKVKDIKKADVQELMYKQEEHPVTANKVLSVIRRILNEAVDNDIVDKNVALNIKKLRVIKTDKVPLTEEEDQLLLRCTNKHAPFFLVMRYTGLRREEIVPLTVEDVDLENRIITINKAVTFIHNQPNIKQTKNYTKREVPILDNIYPILEKLVRQAQLENRELLFVTERDKNMLTESAIKRHLESLLNELNEGRANKIYFTCHQFRHSYCTMLYYAGVGIKEAQLLMGHQSARMVYDIYTHLDETQKDKATTQINNYLKNTRNE